MLVATQQQNQGATRGLPRENKVYSVFFPIDAERTMVEVGPARTHGKTMPRASCNGAN
jgi:hypothetical protein